ncbi:MAG: hypothetical protein CME65_00395 [Halobacteriovoraceae bacterium]|nr:hypothetical protein [Halobacteriovoraceae bacterium]
MSLFSKLHIVDQFIEESLLLEKIDEQIMFFKDPKSLWVGREVVGFDPQLKNFGSMDLIDFNPTQAQRETVSLESLDDLERYLEFKIGYELLRGSLDLSGELTIDYFNSF